MKLLEGINLLFGEPLLCKYGNNFVSRDPWFDSTKFELTVGRNLAHHYTNDVV